VIGVAWFQAILDGVGWVLARFYDVVPNYGVAIILLTLVIRLLLLPLGIKQIRSMQATAVMQPKMKAIQQKYKQDRQRQQEEMMKLYKEYGYNPLSGCFPLLAQLPVLIALFAVLQFPKGLTHIPPKSDLFVAISNQDTQFLGANLVCSAVQSGNPNVAAPSAPAGIKLDTKTLNCGSNAAARIPYYAFALLMVGTTYFQQRQIQRSSPAGQNPQQQTIMRIMPLLFGVWGFIFPAGLVVYWTTTNAVQIGQQYILIHRKGAPLAPPAAGGDGEGKTTKPRPSGGKGAPTGRAGGRTEQRRGTGTKASGSGKSSTRSSFGGRRGGVSGSTGLRSTGGGGGRAARPKPDANGGRSRRQSGGADGGSGARDARDRKKRPDR
jgi:YidC/Oxa1 family membrane protein insertase